MAKSHRKKKNINKDLLYYEIDYIYTNSKYYETLKNLGEETFTFLQLLRNLEIQRLRLIKESVDIYL